MTIAALAAALAVGSAALAQDTAERDTRDVTVTYHDLNLGIDADAATALARIERAASTACGGITNSRDIDERREYRACVRAATQAAVSALAAPRVTALYEGQRPYSFDLASAHRIPR
jgi:UrcA family protein